MCVSPFLSLVRKVKCTTWLAKLEEMITFTLKEALMTALLSLVDEELVSLCGAAMFWRVCWQDCRTTILDRMWGYSDPNALDRRRIGFIKYEMIRALNMPQYYYDNDRHVRFYRERMGIPWLPLDKLNLFP
jgi:hypothetical protein